VLLDRCSRELLLQTELEQLQLVISQVGNTEQFLLQVRIHHDGGNVVGDGSHGALHFFVVMVSHCLDEIVNTIVANRLMCLLNSSSNSSSTSTSSMSTSGSTLGVGSLYVYSILAISALGRVCWSPSARQQTRTMINKNAHLL
jgi:hypothetical protein